MAPGMISHIRLNQGSVQTGRPCKQLKSILLSIIFVCDSMYRI